MSLKDEFYNGFIKVRNRKVEMKWTGENATHILVNYLLNDGIHDLTHLKNCYEKKNK